MSGTAPAVLHVFDDGVARVTINRPDARNALSGEVMEGLLEAFDRSAADPLVRVVVLTGAGEKAFCAGGDLGGSGLRAAGRGAPGPPRPERGFAERHHDRRNFADLFRRMNRLGKPIIARVRGHCLAGGLGSALGCDLVVASDDSSFGTPEVKRGLFPMMIMATIFRNVGRKKGIELLLTGDRIVAADAERLARDAFYTMSDMPFDPALEYLQTMLTVNLGTEDAIEGVTAFLQKRDPAWKGR